MLERYIFIAAALIVLVVILLFNIRQRQKIIPLLSEWFSVDFDEMEVRLSAKPLGKNSWEQSFLWSDVIRVCYKSEGMLASDGIYIFTNKRRESFVIPTEAQGGVELWSKIIALNLFPAELAIKVASSEGGEYVCWPRIN